jgi:hypothetical protein
VAGVLAVLPWVVERPQLASFVLAPIVLLLAQRAATLRAPLPSIAGLFVVFALWANLHSAALSGVAIVAAVGVGAVLDDRRGHRAATAARAAAALVAAGLGTLLTPFGVSLWTHAAEVRRASAGSISEWEPLWSSGPVGWVWLGVVFVACGAALRTGARRLTIVLPLLATALLAVDAIRSVPTFVAVAAVVLPAVAGPVTSPLSRRTDLARVATVALLAVAVVIAAVRAPTTADPADDTPVAATDALPEGCRLLNDYRFGNWVMFDRPGILVSDDGRNDLHGDTSAFDRLVAGEPGSVERIAELDIDCVLVSSQTPLVGELTGGGWLVAGNDGIAVAMVAPPSAE